MLRRFVALLGLLMLVAGCSSSSNSGEIAFEHVFDIPTESSVWTATGEAVDNGLLCSSAKGALVGFEDEDGTARTPPDIGALYEVGEPFVNVSVESMTCDNGSGEFTLRFINDLDPSISDGPPVVASAWTITGGMGYGNTVGEGDSELPQDDGTSSSYAGSGTITEE
ncbi:hypothetical protein ACFLQ7_03690 [Actinomycetota bacterium]